MFRHHVLERVGEVRAVLRLPARVRVVLEIVCMRKMIDRREQLSRELLPIRLDAADRDSAESNAVIAALPADESNTLRLAFGLPIRERNLERCIDGFRTRVAEEHVVDA